MGISLGVQYCSVDNGAGVQLCVPSHTYRPFPQSLVKAPGTLVFEVPAILKRSYIIKEPRDAYWWSDIQFLPNNDARFVMTAGAFQPRYNHSWVAYKHIPNGRLTRIDIRQSCDHGGLIFSESRMSNFPKVHPHPSGAYVGYVGLQAVKVETIDNEDIYNKLKDLRSSNYRFCAFSPDGREFAIILSASRCFELLISSVKRSTTHGDKCISLSKTFSNFSGSTRYNEHLECKWSPDSKYIAVCTSIRKLVVINKELEPVLDVFDELLPSDLYPSWSCSYDFDPRSCHDVLAVGASDGCLYVISPTQPSVIFQTDPLGRSAIDCVNYNKVGTKIAVSLRDFQVLLLDSNTGETTFRLNMTESVPNLDIRFDGYPSVMRLCFTDTGDHLATASCDGRVRIWQLPVEISLVKLCKFKILMHVPMPKLKQLPLPRKLIHSFFTFPEEA